MKRLTCEMCGSTDLIKDGGVFVCQSCGCKYSIEEARKMMVEGTVEVTGTVRLDNSSAISNYLDLARNAIDANSNKEADEYCNKIIEIEATNWEAWYIKGRAVGWQSTLGHNRVGETINAFSKALENCPEDKKVLLGEECKRQLDLLHSAMLVTRMKHFVPHPDDHDVSGLECDVKTIVITTLNFLLKANIKVEAIERIKYIQIIYNGICDAWETVYSNYQGDEYHPSDYEFKRLLDEGECLLASLKLGLTLCSDKDSNKIANDVKIRIYNKLIHIQTVIMNSQSYNVNFSGGRKHYNRGLHLTDQAIALRQSEIDEWNRHISEIRAVEKEAEQRAEEEKKKNIKKKIGEYWMCHAEEKAQIQMLEAQRNELQRKCDAFQNDIDRLQEELKTLPVLAQYEKKLAEIEEVENNIKKLGFFQGKEKKRLQERLRSISDEAGDLMKVVTSEQDEVKKKIVILKKHLKQLLSESSALNDKITQLNTIAIEFASAENDEPKNFQPTIGGFREETSGFDVVIVEVGVNRMQVTKLIKETTGLELREVTAIVNGAPKIVKKNISKDEAEDIKRKLERLGGIAEIK